MTTAELPGATPGRAARIAALHMLATWFADHGEESTPRTVYAQHIITPADEPDQATRVAAVVDFGRRHGVDVREGEVYVWAELLMGAPEVHGVRVSYTLSAEKDRPRPVLPELVRERFIPDGFTLDVLGLRA